MIWDPLRKKNVALTPEEGVRQWFIKVLHEQVGIPLHMMASEVGFKFGSDVGGLEGVKRKEYRADIVVYDRAARPLMIAECKRPEVELSDAVLQQALRYNRVLDVRYLALTNGTRTLLLKREGETFVFLDQVPTWEEMIG
ncbi:MAG: type I restriction enzyme HsdR N-terminal domain-containing protein [Bacteroidales bacterium]|nr:type I restriction enzyme HsdR N-terminal domain-containing protein [Bacteroidales bacterium]